MYPPEELYALSPEDEKQLLYAKKLINDSDIQSFVINIDYDVGSLIITFKTQEIADANISKIEQLISVPYYIEISSEPDTDVWFDANSSSLVETAIT